jgi:hypothetical protein
VPASRSARRYLFAWGGLAAGKKEAARVDSRRDGTFTGGWAPAIVFRLGIEDQANADGNVRLASWDEAARLGGDGMPRRVRLAGNELRLGERQRTTQEQSEQGTQPRTTLRTRGSLHRQPATHCATAPANFESCPGILYYAQRFGLSRTVSPGWPNVHARARSVNPP